MNKKNKQIIFAFLLLFIFGLLVVFVFDIDCVFKSVFNIPCPGCGLTRGFKALFSGHIIKAESYNILTIPIFLFLMLFLILMLKDLITKGDSALRYLNRFTNHYILIIVIVCINWIINIIRGI